MKRNRLWWSIYAALSYPRSKPVMHGINAYGLDVLRPYYVVGIR